MRILKPGGILIFNIAKLDNDPTDKVMPALRKIIHGMADNGQCEIVETVRIFLICMSTLFKNARQKKERWKTLLFQKIVVDDRCCKPTSLPFPSLHHPETFHPLSGYRYNHDNLQFKT